MKHLVKDLKGGVQVEKILPGSPNQTLKGEDIIIKAKGKRIMKGHELLALFKDKPSPVNIEVLREGQKKVLRIRADDVTKRVEQNLVDLKTTVCKFEDVKKKSSLCDQPERAY
jgi:S1-C subfamily serine protease